MNTPLLSVCLITYNHENYIRQAIEGVLMQKVDFDWELIIADDCSTDRTREIVLEYKNKYPDFIKLILQEKNVGPAKNWIDLIKAPKSKYIAYFEGDDYWIDPLKLQKQVHFLENNQEYNLCHSDVNIIDQHGRVNENTSMKLWNYKNDHLDYQFSIFYPIAFSCTAVFRNINVGNKCQKKIISGDWMLWILLTLKGNAKFIDEKLAVYRTGVGVSNNIIWHKNFGYRTLFLLNQLSFHISFKKNYWLLRGGIYFFLIYISRIFNITLIAKIANKFNFKTTKIMIKKD